MNELYSSYIRQDDMSVYYWLLLWDRNHSSFLSLPIAAPEVESPLFTHRQS